jgi:hypothetical protein
MLGRNIWKEDRRTQHDLVVCTLTGFPVSPTCEFSIGGLYREQEAAIR